MQLVERMLCINNIKEIGAEKIQKLDKKFHVFLMLFDDDGAPEIDWEFCLFTATQHQFNTLFENFIPVPKEEDKPKSNLILDDKVTETKPKLII